MLRIKCVLLPSVDYLDHVKFLDQRHPPGTRPDYMQVRALQLGAVDDIVSIPTLHRSYTMTSRLRIVPDGFCAAAQCEGELQLALCRLRAQSDHVHILRSHVAASADVPISFSSYRPAYRADLQADRRSSCRNDSECWQEADRVAAWLLWSASDCCVLQPQSSLEHCGTTSTKMTWLID